MEILSEGPLVEALKRGRDGFNARFAHARRTNRRLDPADLAWHLKRVFDPVVRVVEDADSSAVDDVTTVLFDLSLDLLGKDCLGPSARYPGVSRSWLHLFPAAVKLLIREPRRLAAAVSNAAYNLARQSDNTADRWTKRMIGLVPLCPDTDAFLEAGKVAAWRCGMAHYRTGAIQAWHNLPEDLGLAVLNLSKAKTQPSREDIVRALADPWQHVETAGKKLKYNLQVVARIGGFQGFGGPFVRPPEVMLADGWIYATDWNYSYSLHADCYGAVFKRYGPDLPENVGGRSGFGLDKKGKVTKGKVSRTFSELAGFSGFAATEDTLAVTLPRSHRVWLIALSPENGS